MQESSKYKRVGKELKTEYTLAIIIIRKKTDRVESIKNEKQKLNSFLQNEKTKHLKIKATNKLKHGEKKSYE